MWKVYVGYATITTKVFAPGNGQFWCFLLLFIYIYIYFFLWGGGVMLNMHPMSFESMTLPSTLLL